MQLPILKEIVPTDFSDVNLREALSQPHLGKAPSYLTLPSSLNLKETNSIIEKILTNLTSRKIDPKLPYPLYIITPLEIFHEKINILKSISFLPKYFKCSKTRQSTKENNLLKKLYVQTTKIGHQIEYNNGGFKEYMRLAKKLYQVTHAEAFYQKINEPLSEK